MFLRCARSGGRLQTGPSTHKDTDLSHHTPFAWGWWRSFLGLPLDSPLPGGMKELITQKGRTQWKWAGVGWSQAGTQGLVLSSRAGPNPLWGSHHPFSATRQDCTDPSIIAHGPGLSLLQTHLCIRTVKNSGRQEGGSRQYSLSRGNHPPASQRSGESLGWVSCGPHISLWLTKIQFVCIIRAGTTSASHPVVHVFLSPHVEEPTHEKAVI